MTEFVGSFLGSSAIDLIESIEEAIVVTDLEVESPGPRIVFVNRAWERLTGFRAAEVAGLTPRVLQGPMTNRVELERLRRCLETDRPFVGVTRNYRRSGESFDMQLVIETLRPPFGEAVGFIGVERERPPDTSHSDDSSFLKRAQTCLVEIARAMASAEHATSLGEDTRFEEVAERSLTPRQREIANLLVSGHDVAEIAIALDISPNTVRNHRSAIYRRLGVHAQTEMMARWGSRSIKRTS